MPYRPFRRALLAVLIAATVSAAGCDDDTTTPIEPTLPPTVTESFSGTITPNGAATHPFATQRSGSVEVTLVSVSPDSSVVLGLSLGTWNGVVCQIILANDNATQGAVVSGTVTSFGTLCVRVYDVGRFTEPVSYEVQVVHP
jgi:hypothetical protein